MGFKTKHLQGEEVKMADNVSFKVYLKDPSQGEETEVRRFVVDKEVSTSLVYKCVVCDDYDLCAACEKAGKHPGHNMMRISSPEVIWSQRLFKRPRTGTSARCSTFSSRSRSGQRNVPGIPLGCFAVVLSAGNPILIFLGSSIGRASTL